MCIEGCYGAEFHIWNDHRMVLYPGLEMINTYIITSHKIISKYIGP